MGRKRTKITMDESASCEIKERISSTRDPRQKERLQVILWAGTGKYTLAELAQLSGRARSTIQVWLEDYTSQGMEALLERETSPGAPSPLQDETIQKELREGLKEGRWRTAGQVAQWLKKEHGIERAAKSLYRWLGKAGGALRVPRPRHKEQDPQATQAFRKELAQRLTALELPKGKPIKIWIADEGRFGLHTQTRRCWTLRGHKVIAPHQHRYEWEYVYGAVEVVEGLAQFQFLPSVNLELSRGFLQQIADADPLAEHVVIWDQAGFHPRPEDRLLPQRIHLLPLPPYSPELNPVEGLWDQVKDLTRNRLFSSLEDMETTLTDALRPFWERPARVLSLIHHWLHAQANISFPIINTD